jgi:aromatic ring hydroxylase
VADDPALAPGVNAIAKTYELALDEALADVMRMQVGG